MVNHLRLGEELLNMKDPPIRALYISANNPAVTCPEVHKVRKGLSREDLFTVVHDPFMTDTAKYADIVLPAASYLETDDLYRAYGAYWMQWGQQAAKPQGEARSNFDVAQALAQRMGLDRHDLHAVAAGRRARTVQGRDGTGRRGRSGEAVRRRADPHRARLERPALQDAVGQARILLRAARQAGRARRCPTGTRIPSRRPKPPNGRCAC